MVRMREPVEGSMWIILVSQVMTRCVFKPLFGALCKERLSDREVLVLAQQPSSSLLAAWGAAPYCYDWCTAAGFFPDLSWPYEQPQCTERSRWLLLCLSSSKHPRDWRWSVFSPLLSSGLQSPLPSSAQTHIVKQFSFTALSWISFLGFKSKFKNKMLQNNTGATVLSSSRSTESALSQLHNNLLWLHSSLRGKYIPLHQTKQI